MPTPDPTVVNKPKYTFPFNHFIIPSTIKEVIEDIVYPPRKYLGYRNSAIVKLKNGGEVTLLFLLAKIKKPEYDPDKEEAVWENGNWYDVRPGNIKFLPRESKTALRPGRPSKLDLGVPFNHPDYARRYYELNKAKRRDYARNRYAKMKSALEVLKDQAGEVKPEGMPSDPIASAMQDRLNDILTTQKVVAKPSAPPTKTDSGLTWKSVKEQRRYPFGNDDPDYNLDDLGDLPQVTKE